MICFELLAFVMMLGFAKLDEIEDELALTVIAAGFGKICCGALFCFAFPTIVLLELA